MPLSKNGVPYYTDAQYDLARYESSALEYARATGYQLEKKGGWWTMKAHDSFVFAPNGMWFWNSREMKGGDLPPQKSTGSNVSKQPVLQHIPLG